MKTRKTKGCFVWALVLLCLGIGRGVVQGADLLSGSSALKPITVNDTDHAIRIDGYLVDWPVSRMIVLNQKSQVTYGVLNWKGKDDFNGKIFLTYDSQYLYLSAIVQKTSTVVNDNSGMSLWAGDCIELFLSSGSVDQHSTRLSKRDYHIGFSPGSNCQNPQMFCFNKEETIGGGRVMARSTTHGYILEACVPLSYFDGLEIGPGKTTQFNLILDEGGSFSKNRILQLDLTGNAQSWDNPSLWGSIEWIGKTTVSIPRNEPENLYADLVMDGTKGSIYWGHRTLTGVVLDAQGKPISGALITTWPKTKTVTAQEDGSFTLNDVKTYDKTVVYAQMDGYAASLAAMNRKMNPVTIHLMALPNFFVSDTGGDSDLEGGTFQVPADGHLLDILKGERDWVKPMNLHFLKLVGTQVLLTENQNDQYAVLDGFIHEVRQLGAEPIIELPIVKEDPSVVADWVRHCNQEMNEEVTYWTVGNEPDLSSAPGVHSAFGDYNVYDYINDFRQIYNSVKRIDPSVLILGPELAWRYTSRENDWFTPFIQFDGDIVNLVSIHHYGSIQASQCDPENVMSDVLQMQTLLRGLENRIAVNSDVYLPLVVTGGNVCIEATGNTLVPQFSPTPTLSVVLTPTPSVKSLIAKDKSGKKIAKQVIPPKEDAGPNSFWAALWAADQAGTLMINHIPMAFFSYLGGDGQLNFLNAKGGKPIYWALRLVNTYMKGQPIWSQVQNGDVLVYATQNPKTKDVSLMILNKGGSYYHPKILLNDMPADISVDAGLNQTFDYEIPFYSISFLTIKANRSRDEAVLYTRKMAQAGKPPLVTLIRPW